MCGIAGYFNFMEGALPEAEIQLKVFDSLRRRGPDGSGIWRHPKGRALFLHRRLSIQDLSETGAQPMHSDDGSLVITFNGEIYNVNELRKWVPDYLFRGTSDTEVLLALYKKYGSEMVHFLRGMFAFAIWDERKQGLFLARDTYGIKPLYLAETSTGVWFSSQVKSLLQVPQIDLSEEPAGHAGFFLWGSVPEPYTLYKGIRSLRSGHSLWLQRGREPSYKYFSSIAKILTDAMPLPEGESRMLRLQSALRDTVGAHFVSDVPVGIFLSAGLDSSTILGIASEKFCAKRLSSLTLSFDVYRNTSNDEADEAMEIAEHYDVPHKILTVGQHDFESELANFLEAMDQPSIDGINTYFVARMANAAGFKVALSGIGGDEIFGGYRSFRQIPQMMHLVRSLGVPTKFGKSIRRSTEYLFRRVTSPKYAGVLEFGGSVEGAYLLRRGLFMPWELSSVLDPELANAGLEELQHSYFEAEELRTVKDLSLYLQVCFLESTRYMRNQLLRDADWAGMFHSVELRTPLVDQVFLKQLSPILRSKCVPDKLAMAMTLKKPLSYSVLNRKKTGFQVPVREWLTKSLREKPERGLRSWAKFIYKHETQMNG